MTGRRRRNEHSSLDKHKQPDKQKPCRNFLKAGECRFGEKCKFSHAATGGGKTISINKKSDTTSKKNTRATTTTPEKLRYQLNPPINVTGGGEINYNDWRFHIRKIGPQAPSMLGGAGVDAARLGDLWLGAVEILNRNVPELHQQRL